MSWRSDIRVVVAIDFGTTYSGFAYAHKQNPEIITNDVWPEVIGTIKTNTVLQYDEKYKNVQEWGYPALAKRPQRKGRSKNVVYKPVELFKLHLGDIPESEKRPLPKGLDYKKAITDYLREMGTLEVRWPGLDFLNHVLMVLTVPAEYSEKSKGILRECAYNAGLIGNLKSEKLQFSTEPEAAAIHCMRVLKEYFATTEGKSFLIVDAGGGTVDLTTRRFITGDQLGEVTERTGDFCGSAYVDREFLKLMKRHIGDQTMNILEEQHYGQLQYMVQEFCRRVKLLFTGNPEEFKIFELDLEEVCPVVKQYVTGSYKEKLEDDEWIIELDFESVKAMFDPIIGRIIRLISGQLNAGGECSVMFLVGGFSESKYLQSRIRQEFASRIKDIAVPKQPQAAIVRGALDYGLKMDTIKTRVLKYTYGIEVQNLHGMFDPPERKVDGKYIFKFHKLVERGQEVGVDEAFGESFKPLEHTTSLRFTVYFTKEKKGTYCDELGMSLLGEIIVDMPDTYLGKERPVDFRLMFGRMEITAIAKNQLTGHEYKSTFKLEL
ncbi:6424_t:CDS:2 [Acaulospora morrowiae]|uniref:6424_t:CDS:1 n=1 Tax=Acaulospora morrowiae TaxID=94023 RepID=A0A9N9HQY7_9GLOM|nr:6424_t:CDS:2 [Acaulospora morrowiae]